MGFWQLSSGINASGSPLDSFASYSSIIPDGTKAKSEIIKMMIEHRNAKPFINVTWKIKSGDFINRIVFQKIHCWDDNEQKADRAKNMLLLILKIGNAEPLHQQEPTDRDFTAVVGKLYGIKIQSWEIDDKQGNFVSEVHPSDGFISETGVNKVFSAKPNAHLSSAPSNVNDDIPF